MTSRVALMICGLTLSALAQDNWGKLKVNKMELTMEYENGSLPIKHKMPMLVSVNADAITSVSNTMNYDDGSPHHDPHKQLFTIQAKDIKHIGYANTGGAGTYSGERIIEGTPLGGYVSPIVSPRSTRKHYVSLIWGDNNIVVRVSESDYLGLLLCS
jgi:hypothetical protein